MMMSGTSLKTNKTWWQSLKEGADLTTTQRPADNYGAFGIHTVNLKKTCLARSKPIVMDRPTDGPP